MTNNEPKNYNELNKMSLKAAISDSLSDNRSAQNT